jgi:hypothetical protein
VLLSAVVANCVLVVVGVLLVPATLGSITGVGIVVADIGLQVAIAVLGWRGPVSLGRLGGSSEWCLAVGAAFAAVYLGDLVFDLVGQPLPLNPYLFFLAAAVAGCTPVALRARRTGRTILAAVWSLTLGTVLWSTAWLVTAYAFWGTREEHGFWLRDGALSAFHHSGTSNLSVFLLQDLQGAVFFHPFLSALIGVLCGFFAAAAVLIVTTLPRRLGLHAD